MKSTRKLIHHRKFWPLITAVAIVLVIGVIGTLRVWYTNNLRPVSNVNTKVYFNVESGETKHAIAEKLEREKLIRSSQAFETYLKSSEVQILQAGTYSLSPSMSVQVIVKKMVEGDVTKNLLTILPGKRLDQIEKAFSEAGYGSSAINAAFKVGAYRDHPALASLPRGASLEGYLYPDSYQQLATTPAQTIVRQSLDEMQKYLTYDVTSGFAKQGLSTYKAITLASIVLQETDDPDYQPMVAQVFFNRIKKGIALESDATYVYAADKVNQPRSSDFDSPYNTYLHKGLPPGPISNVTSSALKAVAHPKDNDYLYFVAGDDGKIYFSRTLEEHQQNVREHCKKQCA